MEPQYKLNNSGNEVQDALDKALNVFPGQIAARAEKTNVLLKDNISVYVPSSDYHPATKKYVDEQGINVAVGTVTTGEPGTSAAVSNIGTAHDAILNFTIPKGNVGPQGEQGVQGTQGVKGDSATISVGTVTTGAAGSGATITNVGTQSAAVFNFVIPKGDTGATGATGSQGIQGIQGNIGPANTLSIGDVGGGLSASATITGQAPNQVLNLVLPKGDTGATGAKGDTGATGAKGDTGATGPANTLSIGTVASGASPSATITGTAPNQTLNLILQKGDKGDTGNTGATGASNVLSIGTVSGGTTASATITGTSPSQTLNLVLPKGDKGDTGATGAQGDVHWASDTPISITGIWVGTQAQYDAISSKSTTTLYHVTA